jgi:hypothetical protein
MSTTDQVAEERQRYMASARTSRDWLHYVTTVEHLRKVTMEPPWRGVHQHRPEGPSTLSTTQVRSQAG